MTMELDKCLYAYTNSWHDKYRLITYDDSETAAISPALFLDS